MIIGTTLNQAVAKHVKRMEVLTAKMKAGELTARQAIADMSRSETKLNLERAAILDLNGY